MIGLSFVCFNALILFFVYLDEQLPGIGFIDYYSFKSTYTYLQSDNIFYSWVLLLFVFSTTYFFTFFLKKNVKRHKKNAIKFYSFNIKIRYLLLLCFINILLLHLQYGALVYYSSIYHPDISYGFFYIAYIFTLAVSIFLFSITTGIVNKVLLFFVVFFSMAIATRITGVLLVFCGFIFLYNGKFLKSFLYFFIGTIVVTLALLLRSMDAHGLVNYITNFNIENFFYYLVASISYAFNFSFYLSVASYYDFLQKNIPLNSILVCFNPMPGSLAGWYGETQRLFTVQHNVPSSAWGSIIAFGYMWSIPLFMVLAVWIRVLDYYIVKNKNLLSFLVLILSFMFIIYFAQYQIRSSFSFLYYATALILTPPFFRLFYKR